MEKEPIIVLREVIVSPGGILLIRRSSTERINPGKWEFPGGKVNEGEILKSALRREREEETGIEGTSIGGLRLLGTKTEEAILPEYKGQLIITHYILGTKSKIPAVRLSKEHNAAEWIKNIEQLQYYDVDKKTREIITAILEKRIKIKSNIIF